MSPKIRFVRAVNNYILEVVFDNQCKKKYDIRPLLKKDTFLPLKNPMFFKNVQIEPGGYAVFWDQNIDISEYELWTNGFTVS